MQNHSMHYFAHLKDAVVSAPLVEQFALIFVGDFKFVHAVKSKCRFR